MSSRVRPLIRSLATAGLILVTFPSFAGIVAYWRFEEGTGIARDETGRYDADLINFEDSEYEGWSTDVFAPIIPLTGQTNAGSIRMQGGSEYVDFSNWENMYLGTSFTIEFFMKPDMPVIASATFGLEPVSALFLPLIVSSGDLYWRPQFQEHLEFVPADLVIIGQWQHVALVKEPGEYSIYINGMLQYNGLLPAGTDGPYWFPGTDRPGDRTIGGDSGTFRGWIDEFRISSVALTPDQFLIAPEPSTFLLMGIGTAALALYSRRRFRQK
jgi:hypothetical protein